MSVVVDESNRQSYSLVVDERNRQNYSLVVDERIVVLKPSV
jgi:hypothetical protein